MSFYDFFHKFFEDFQEDNFRPPGNEERYGFNNSRDPPIWDPQNEDDARHFRSTFTEVLTDPVEMHKFFEQQFSEMFKVFSIPEEFFGFHRPGILQPPNIPTIEGTDPRDHYLKPEYKNETHPKVDSFEKEHDQRSKSFSSWLDDRWAPSSPGDKSQPRVFSSFSSVTRKTVRLPDGSVKTEEIIRNPDGTEKRTESQTLPDGSSSTNFDSPFIDSGFFNIPKMPKIKGMDPRDKPGFEKAEPYEEKVDKDLDKQIKESGVKSLPPFSTVQPSTDRSFVKITVTSPNGIVETEEVVRNPDGTEKKTVTQVFPDGTSKTISTDSPGGQIYLKSQVPREDKTSNRTTPFSFTSVVKDLIDVLFK